jgi:hypothetical protein
MKRFPSKRAAALVIILAMIALLTVTMLAFFSRATLNRQISANSALGLKSDTLAQGALDVIVADLAREIKAGSIAHSRGTDQTIYMPVTNLTVVPSTAGSDANLVNMIKRSAFEVPFYPAAFPYDAVQHPPSHDASPISTGDRGIGRAVTPARWNSHYFLPVDPGSADSSPISAFRPPDWVLFTREGPQAFPAWDDALKDSSLDNNLFVVGRYAYVIYDEGGLLNINACGFPASLSASDASRKGPLLLANLRSLFSPGAGIDTDALVAWRNGSLSDNPAAFLQFALDPAVNRNFKRVLPNDEIFLSRQDLIRFSENRPSVIPKNALQYLATFTCEHNRPVSAPVTPPGSTLDYGTLADDPPSANRRFLNVRCLSDAAMTTHELDGSVTTSDVRAGDPLIQRRFSLSRLRWLSPTGPANGGTAQALRAHFGLVWDERQRWVYTSPTSTGTGGGFNGVSGSAATAIKTLNEVASENRQPDFFEILKAGILSGSLGQSGGDTGLATGALDGSLDIHILRIGANIIDQADEDSKPTAIGFSHPALIKDASGALMDIYGVEDLPYIYRTYEAVYRPSVSGRYSGVQPRLGAWRAFEMWNPHQKACPWPVSPRRFRVAAMAGGVRVAVDALRMRLPAPLPSSDWRNGPFVDVLGARTYTRGNRMAAEAYFDDPGAPRITYQSANPETIEFMVDETNGWDYRHPTILNQFQPRTGNVDAASDGRIAYQGSAQTTNPRNAFQDSYHNILGIHSGGPNADGTWDAPDARITKNPNHLVYIYIRMLPDPFVTYELQYQDGAEWKTYQVLRMEGFSGTPAPYDEYADNGDTATIKASFAAVRRRYGAPRRGLVKADPRATRFGASEVWVEYDNTAFRPYAYAANGALRAANDDRLGGKAFTNFLPGGSLWTHQAIQSSGSPLPAPREGGVNLGVFPLGNLGWSPDNTSTTTSSFYIDRDGIARPGDGFRLPTASSTGTAPASESGNPLAFPTLLANNSPQRPIVLNRPFRSVGELGYVFRDLPWKTLDFFSERSADAALLDLFSVDDTDVAIARVNLNTRQQPVLKAMLAGALKQEFAATILPNTLDADADALAAALVSRARNASAPYFRGPLEHRGSVVEALSASTGAGDPAHILNTAGPNQIKERREAAIRALADAGTTSVWNLFIDVIAQSGRYPPAASSLEQFLVEGERRYWLHVAMDRFTGRVIAQQLEIVDD